MFTVEIKHESDNRQEFGYGVYVNAYVTWTDIVNDTPTMYASECVSFGQNTDENIKAAERRVRRNADRRASQECGL